MREAVCGGLLGSSRRTQPDDESHKATAQPAARVNSIVTAAPSLSGCAVGCLSAVLLVCQIYHLAIYARRDDDCKLSASSSSRS